MRAIQVTEFGGPEVLEAVELPDPECPPGFMLVEVTSAGVNYADTHATDNSYLSPQSLPFVPGSEIVGRVIHDRTSEGPEPLNSAAGGSPKSASATPADSDKISELPVQGAAAK